MAISKADIVALRQQIETEKRKHDSASASLQLELDALAVLDKRVGLDQQTPLDLGAPAPHRPHMSFSKAVREAVHHFNDEEFTVTNVESILKAQGIPLPERNTRTRISIEVKDMLRKGGIKLIRAGSGNAPHVYRRVLIQPRGVSEKGEGVERSSAQTPSNINLQH